MKNVKDIYALSPMQQGLLFHALSDSSDGAYVERISWTLSGDLDADAFRSAWQHTVESYPILSTCFHFEGLNEPVQVVRQRVELPWQELDWLHLTTGEQEQLFADLLKEERQRGFKLNSAPLMRLTLLHVGPMLYRFLWSYHHLLLDGWSIPLVLRHVLEAYEALRHSQSPPAAVSRPYSDYIGWLQQQDVKAAEAFWRGKLKGFTVPTMVGVERSSRFESQSGERYRKLHRVMSIDTATGLQTLARQHQLTLNPLVQAAWALLLSRYSGEPEVLFGTVVSGRPTILEGAETMVGLFINTVPVRVKVSEGEWLLEWLKELQAQQVQMQQYEYSALRQVQRWSDVRNGQPLFDSVVVVRNLPIDESLRQQGAVTEVKDLLHHEMATGHPLTLGVVLDQGLKLQLTYDSEKYHEDTIQQMLGHVEHLLEEIVANPDRRISELRMLTAAEQHYLSETVNETERSFAIELAVPQLLAQQAQRSGSATALSFGETALSYAELNERANQLAHLLLGRGVGAGQIVAVCLERSVESVICLLAIWKAGAAYLPLDIEQPLPRLQLMLTDAAPALVLSTTELSGRLELADKLDQEVLQLEAIAELLQRQPLHDPPGAVAGSDLAYVIYTSGSTGVPKGVMVEHGQLLNTLLGAQELYQFSAQEVVACVAPFAFDISLFELLAPLLVGGRVLLVSGRELLEEEKAAEVLGQVTYLHGAPGLMRQLAAFRLGPGVGQAQQVRAVMVGGDAVSPELLRELREGWPEARLYVGYGPTEAAIMCAGYEVRRGGEVAQRMLGYPLGNTKLRLYDGQGQLVPLGVVGEVYIGGASVSRGYLRREELTAEKFVELEGERWYRSGDLGRRLSDGSVAFAGRADGQVKVRGYRVEVGEVEAALESHATVREAAVALKLDGDGAGRLVGYVVSEEGVSAQSEELRRYLGERLPAYMVPVVIVELEQLPLTALAKLDRKALPEPGIIHLELEHGKVAPRTIIEEMVAGIWAEMLKVERVGTHDNFFEAGGDSLLATQLVSRVREALKVELALRELFEHPTVAGLAERVEEALRTGAGVSAPPMERVARDGKLVLSFAQQRLWFIDQLQPGSALYNMPHAIRMFGQLKVETLERTISEIVRRHESLRTTFMTVAGEPVQIVNPAEPIKLMVVDLSMMDGSEREEKTRQMISEESLRPFDLSRGPLLRVGLLKLAEDEHIALFTTHHIISDGWSVGLLIKEVGMLYAAYQGAEPASLAELPIQYADFAHWQREWLKGEVLESELAYWRSALRGAPAVLELPTDHSRPALQSHRGAQHLFSFPSELKRSLEAVGRRERVTLFMTLLAAWQTLLMRYSGQQDIVVGVPVANRNYKDTEALIGFFVNMLPLRADLSGNPSFSELLAQVRETALGAYAHQDLPFEKLVEELQPARSLSHSPVFQVIFVLENVQTWALQLPGLELSPVEQRGGTSIFDLSLGMAETAEGLSGILEYNTDLFERETIERMAVHFERLLESVVTDAAQRLSELRMLTAAEQHYLSETVNETERSFAIELAVPQLFAQQAQRSGSATALSFGETALSYAELNERANRLAHLLLGRGVGVGQIVAVCLERSVESVICLLAIWKAGAAYLPLDIEQPLPRLQLMLTDAAPALVLSTTELSGRLELSDRLDQEVLQLETIAELLQRQPLHDPPVAVAGSDLAYVIYTSGSTGVPKGVMVEHGQLLNTLLGAQELYQFSAQEVVACVAPFAFDISLFELLAPLLVGGRVLLVSGRELLEEEKAAEVLGQVTYLHGAPGLMRQLAAFRLGPGRGQAQQVRAVMVGGDAVSPELLRELREGWPEARLYVGYGPTEAAIMCAGYEVRRGGEVAQRMLGYPLGNTKLRLYDGQGQLVPLGVVGEVYIGGASVSRGYLRREELTAEKFVELEGERWYRSGDLGRRLPDGSVAFAGRADGQVKVRGYRVEVGEVEAALESHATVREAAVALKLDGDGAGRLVGYVVSEEGVSAQAEELRRYLGERLPAYMVPVVIVELEQLPLTALAKLDRKALPEVEPLSGTQAYEGPRTAVEEVLCGIFGEVLKVERVGIRDSFFELGGHSLLATQLMSRVREGLKVELALRELFEHPTVAGLAERVEEALRTGAGVSAPPIERVARDGKLVLSFAQQRLWFFDQLQPASALYNSTERVRLSGQLNLAAMEATLTEIVRRHEMLRTSFTTVEGEPVQVIQPAQPFKLSVIDISELPERETEVQTLAAMEAQQPFDLIRGPLLRVKLLRLQPEEYLLLHTMHHIISDGWSMGVLIREVATLYTAFINSEPSPLSELEVQYADFAAWQRAWLQGEVLAKELDYWKEQLSDAPAVLELPIDHPRPVLQSHRGEHLQIEIPAALTESLQELSRREGVTLFMTLLAAWQTLLMRYSGQEDIVVGTTIANRNRRETEPLIGFFVNTLVLRTNVSGDPSFRELLARVKEVALGAYAHQDLPFEKLVEELRPARSLSHSPVFQVVFGLENVPREPLQLPGLKLTPLHGKESTAKFDLSLAMQEDGDVVGGLLGYNTDLFERETIERMAVHFERLLESVVTDAAQRLSELRMLTAAEQHYLSETVNETERSFAIELAVPQLFAQQAQRSGSATALSFGETALSYAELNERANRLAHLLLGRGVGVGQIVAVCLERSVESVICLLAIWKAGAAYLPLDIEQPLPRLQLMLADAAPALVLSTTELSGRLELSDKLDQEVLQLETIAELLQRQPLHDPPVAVAGSDLAYVIYTSGSTGVPKGVMVEHGQLLNTLLGAQELYQFSAQEVVACVAPFAFDISLFELLAPLLVGGRVLLVSGRELLEEEKAAEVLGQVTYLHGAPGLMRQLAAFRLGPGRGQAQQVRAVMVGGDAVSPELLRELREAWPEARLYVGYGPTEAAIMCAGYEVRRGGEVAQRMLGYPLGNTKLRLYDGQGQLVPLGVVGEVYIGGASVSRGYLRREELTAEKFVELEGERWYRSGDLGRRLSDGSVAFAGRADGQVKVRGYRVEVGEVEAALESHATVREAAVALKLDGDGAGRLVGYVVSEEGVSAQAEELRRYLGERLPAYMVPVVIVELEQLPLTALAKLDRKALPEVEPLSGTQAYEGPRTAVEEVLCGIFGEVLKVERVGIRDSFFELGGHSLLATQLMSRVREGLKVELALRELFEHPTVAGLAERVEEALRTGAGVSAPPIERVARDGKLVLSFAQQRLWFFDQLQPESTIYNMVNPVRLTGHLDVLAMEATLTEIVRRHEMLRTSFTTVEGEPVQVIQPAQPFKLSVIDISELPEREAAIQTLVAREAQQPFDLNHGPLLRVTLIKLAQAEHDKQGEHVVLFTMHHIISDGWSMGVLSREVAALYAAFVNAKPSPLTELGVQYADFAAWQRAWLQGEVLEAQVAYWKGQLEGAPAVLELPTDHPRAPMQSHRGARNSFTLSAALKRSLEELSRREGVTLFMTLLAAWQTLLMRYSGQEDIVVGTTIANRNRRETEPLIGFFVNTLVLRTNVSGDPSFRELLARVKEVALGAYAHQDLPFEKLVEELRPARSLSHSPVFQVVFGLENVPREPLQLPGLELSPVEQHGGTAHFDLSLGMAETAEGLGGILEYNTDLFERETIERMAVHFEGLLESVVTDAAQSLSELRMLTAAEQHYLSETVNETERSFAIELAVPQLFAQQAERSGSATALSFGETALSYAELNERANQLAHVLLGRGVGAGQLVAVCLERSVESVICLLAIWKAGAAYLPLDIEQPLPRLQLMLADAAPALVLSTTELSGRLELSDKLDQEVLQLETIAELLQRQPLHDPPVAVAGNDLAYVLYTSGSTGVPKGVMVEHGQLLNTLLGAQELYRFNADDVAPCLSSFAFDISLLELLLPLLAGGKVLLINAREMLEPKSALEVLSQITFLHAIPAPMRQIAALLSSDAEGNYEQLRAVMVGGDAVSPELVAELLRVLPKARVYICYGPTETTIFCAAYEVNEEQKIEHRMLGRPIANAALRLYDRNVHLVPEGVVGEVYIGGPSVSRGYQNSAELTAEKFVTLEGRRWYRSGDLGRRLPDGSIAFEGRADGQVKVRGYRIEAGEVEAALESHATVRAAAVAVKPDARREARLIGYVVSEEGVTAQAEDLRRYLGERLPAYMVPVMIVVLENLPLTPLGKLDRKALPEVEQVRREYEPPRTATEEILCDIWSEVLKVERVGIRESFFELGGHSLLATQLMSRVRDAFTIELPLRSLFEKPTIAELAVAMEEILIAEISALSGDETSAEEVMSIGSGD